MAALNKITGLALKLRATRLHIGVLRAVRVFWPVMVLVSLFIAFALAGVFERVSPTAAALSALITLIGAVGLTWRRWPEFRWPTEQDARAALDRGSELRPIASLTDRPADVTGPGLALWRAHTQRLKRAAARLPLPTFGTAWKALDPYYLRAVLPVLLDRLLGGGDVAVRGDHDRLGGLLSGTRGGEDLHPVRLAGHLQVGDDQIELAVLELVQGAGEIVDQRADVAQPAEDLGHDLGVVRLVVYDQDLGGRQFGCCFFATHRAGMISGPAAVVCAATACCGLYS